jgi:hypothetical protein
MLRYWKRPVYSYVSSVICLNYCCFNASISNALLMLILTSNATANASKLILQLCPIDHEGEATLACLLPFLKAHHQNSHHHDPPQKTLQKTLRT